MINIRDSTCHRDRKGFDKSIERPFLELVDGLSSMVFNRTRPVKCLADLPSKKKIR